LLIAIGGLSLDLLFHSLTQLVHSVTELCTSVQCELNIILIIINYQDKLYRQYEANGAETCDVC